MSIFANRRHGLPARSVLLVYHGRMWNRKIEKEDKNADESRSVENDSGDCRNQKHPENIACFYTICRPADCQWVPVNQADDETLIRDLEWKRVYLNAKALGKSTEKC